MEDEHREAIRRNISSLVNQTDFERMRSALYEKGVFTEHNMETYNDTSSTQMHRKRCMYNDITRRGPRAFNILLETLEENGYWDLVRMLDPNSILNTFTNNSSTIPSRNPNDYVSLYGKGELEKPKVPQVPDNEAAATSNNNSPVLLNVKKAEKFADHNLNSDIGVYPMRNKMRGVLVLFTYTSFRNNVEKFRAGADVDSDKLRHLFHEMGFKTLNYCNLDLQETHSTLANMRSVLARELGCVFVVVSSHGYEVAASSDTDIRCHDGGLISVKEIISYFSNNRLPHLTDVPKVFVFQTCRGSMDEYVIPVAAATPANLRDLELDGTAIQPESRVPRAIPLFSNVLVVQSTLPGFVSRRDPKEGSWYIQALCDVFAARAHDCDVSTLFTKVDERLRARFHIQSSSVDSWGFNRKLFLHPGLPLTQPHNET